MSFVPPTSKLRQGFKAPTTQKSTNEVDSNTTETQELVPSSQNSEALQADKPCFSVLEEVPEFLSQEFWDNKEFEECSTNKIDMSVFEEVLKAKGEDRDTADMIEKSTNSWSIVDLVNDQFEDKNKAVDATLSETADKDTVMTSTQDDDVKRDPPTYEDVEKALQAKDDLTSGNTPSDPNLVADGQESKTEKAVENKVSDGSKAVSAKAAKPADINNSIKKARKIDKTSSKAEANKPTKAKKAKKEATDGEKQLSDKVVVAAAKVEKTSKNGTNEAVTSSLMVTQRKAESAKERLKFIQELRRNDQTWVECCIDACKKWRFLPDVKDPSQVPEYWTCSMNPDERWNKCEIAEQVMDRVDEMIFSKYTSGSLVWAHRAGHPWWPAMVDDCPDVEAFFWLEPQHHEPQWYHVTFLDTVKRSSVTRAWIRTEELIPFVQGGKPCPFAPGQVYTKVNKRLEKSIEIANYAATMDVVERRKKFSFAARFSGPWGPAISYNDDDRAVDDSVIRYTTATVTARKPKRKSEKGLGQPSKMAKFGKLQKSLNTAIQSEQVEP